MQALIWRNRSVERRRNNERRCNVERRRNGERRKPQASTSNIKIMTMDGHFLVCILCIFSRNQPSILRFQQSIEKRLNLNETPNLLNQNHVDVRRENTDNKFDSQPFQGSYILIQKQKHKSCEKSLRLKNLPKSPEDINECISSSSSRVYPPRSIKKCNRARLRREQELQAPEEELISHIENLVLIFLRLFSHGKW